MVHPRRRQIIGEGDVVTVGPQTRKFGRVFDWFDQTGDGWLTHGDFEAMAEMFKARRTLAGSVATS